MSSSTSTNSTLTVQPAVQWSAIRGSVYDADADRKNTASIVMPPVSRNVEVAVMGDIYTRAEVTAYRVVPSSEDEWRPARHIVQELQDLATLVHHCGTDGATWSGCIYGEGEEQGDVWRLYIRVDDDGYPVAVLDYVTLVWPDGAKLDRDTEWQKRIDW